IKQVFREKSNKIIVILEKKEPASRKKNCLMAAFLSGFRQGRRVSRGAKCSKPYMRFAWGRG
ncbi:MAG: hypothetical protein LIP28_06035, partial [Deltaproteobacteria bacterium]|nr:hypothetical protein [Deltaproteobacteria bacterium]